jgi:hypothetical protein
MTPSRHPLTHRLKLDEAFENTSYTTAMDVKPLKATGDNPRNEISQSRKTKPIELALSANEVYISYRCSSIEILLYTLYVDDLFDQ